MSGVKGRSGRRPWSVEEKRHRVIDKAWEVTSDKLDMQGDKEKYQIAKDIVVKDMVGKENISMQAEIIAKEEQDILSKYNISNRLNMLDKS